MKRPDEMQRLRNKGKRIILKELKKGDMSIEELQGLLERHKLPHAQRIAKEVAWWTAEDGLTRFNNNWCLELVIDT